MIVFGTNSKKIASETVMDKCSNCGNQFCIDVIIYQKWVHVFWVPFFPNGKTGASHCTKCNQVLPPNQMPATIKATYDQLLKQAKAPIWTWVGSAGVVFLIAAMTIVGIRNDAKNKEYVAAPQVGDIYEIKTEDNMYTLYKVEHIEGDSLFVRINEYETNRATGLDDLKRKGEKAYSPVLLPYSKKEIKEMFDKGQLINVNRK